MAYVCICWGKSAAHHLNYAIKDRAPDDVMYAHDCNSETAVSDFESVRAEHGTEDGNQIFLGWDNLLRGPLRHLFAGIRKAIYQVSL